MLGVETFEKLFLLMCITCFEHFTHVIVNHDISRALQHHCIFTFRMVYFIPALLVHTVMLECKLRVFVSSQKLLVENGLGIVVFIIL
jgi:hypothetical protein